MTSSVIARSHTGKAIITQLDILNSLGYEDDKLLLKTGLIRDKLEYTHCEISKESENQFYQNILHLVDDKLIGLQFGEAFSLQKYGLFGYALLSAKTLRHALQFAINFYQLTFTYFTLDFKVYANKAEFSLINPLPTEFEILNLLIDRDISATAVAVSEMIGGKLPLIRVELFHTGHGKQQHYRDYFGCEVLFNQPKSKIIFDASILDTPLPSSDPTTSNYFIQQCQMLIARLSSCSKFVDQVRMIILARPGYFPDIDLISEKLNISSRTLRRKLADEQSSYREILDEIRYKLARDYLTETKLPLREISELLGYSEPGNFTHAFKRWSSESPINYRKTLGVVYFLDT